MSKQTIEFRTEVKQLLDLVIHSLYSNREIFLRELISNASDAIDRVRFEGLTRKEVIEGDENWRIKLVVDAKAKTLTISDNGIGMNRDKVIEDIGTIARSGTKKFLEQLKEAGIKENPELIGQFGVGFYSVFMVADKVTLISRLAGEPKTSAVRWESSGDGTFSLEEAEKETRGTDITLHLKEDAADFLNEYTLRTIVKKFSDFIEHPVVMDVEKEKGKIEEETLNSRKAIWLRPKHEIKEEEYGEFYKHVGRDFTDPLQTIHFSAEGASEFKALLFIPSKAPFSLFETDQKIGIHLYVKRVFIMDDCKKLLPEYLRFVKGVVDSSDLPLNVSRELLQENKEMERIKKGLVNKILATLKELKEKDFKKYLSFHNEFGRVLKEGLHFDHENKDKLLELVLYHSTATEPDLPITLEQYVSRMREGQTEIYYIIGEEMEDVKRSAYLEKFRSKGYEVIFMCDPIDEWVVQAVHEYKGKKLKPVNKGEIDIDEKADKKERKEQEEQLKGLVDFLKGKLPEVKDVRLSSRLTESAVCLVGDDQAMGAHMEKLFKALKQNVPENKPILEINGGHPFIRNMEKLYEKDANHPRLAEYAALLYDQALILDGHRLKDPTGFAARINRLLEAESQGLA